MPETSMKEISYKEGYRLQITLGNGHVIIYNMENKLVTARFHELSDWGIFCSGKIVQSGKVIKWNENTELSIYEILLNIKAV